MNDAVQRLLQAVDAFDWAGGHGANPEDDWTDRPDWDEYTALCNAVGSCEGLDLFEPEVELVQAVRDVVSNYDYDYGDVGGYAIDRMESAAQRVRETRMRSLALRPEGV